MNTKLKFALRAAVSILVLGYLGSILDWQAVRSLDPEIFVIILAGAVIFFMALCIMSFRWKLIIDRVASTSSSFPGLVQIYVIAQFFNLLMPGSIGGDFVRATTAAKRYGFTHKVSFAIVVGERFFGLSAVFLLVVIGFLAYPTYIREVRLNEYFVIVAAFGSVIAFLIGLKLIGRLTKISIVTATALLLISASAHMADVIITFLLAKFFHLEIGFTQLLVVIPIVYFVTILPISLGGLGVREGAMVALLASFNVGETTAIIMAFALYLTKFLVGMLGGLLYFRGGKANDVEN
jgi:uncharacterized membrane protein YbhN (UPF0104 family)